MKLGDAEFEPRNMKISTSTLEARQIFLRLIVQMSRETVDDLVRPFNKEDLPVDLKQNQEMIQSVSNFFLLHITEPKMFNSGHENLAFGANIRNTPILDYSRYLQTNETKYNRLLGRKRKDLDGMAASATETPNLRTARRRMIPGWSTLLEDADAGQLRESILKWANKWNLTDEWCLDFALSVLSVFKLQYVDRYRLDEQVGRDPSFYWHYEWPVADWAWKSWLESVHIIDLQNFDNKIAALNEMPDVGGLVFRWREDDDKDSDTFEVNDYFAPHSCTEREFMERVELEFWRQFLLRFGAVPEDLVGHTKHVLNEIQRFRLELENCVSRCKRKLMPFSRPTVKKDSGESHFRWLIEYQVKGRSFHKLAELVQRDRKSVSAAVKEASGIVGLSLRQAPKAGRRPGIKETTPRIILGR